MISNVYHPLFWGGGSPNQQHLGNFSQIPGFNNPETLLPITITHQNAPSALSAPNTLLNSMTLNDWRKSSSFASNVLYTPMELHGAPLPSTNWLHPQARCPDIFRDDSGVYPTLGISTSATRFDGPQSPSHVNEPRHMIWQCLVTDSDQRFNSSSGLVTDSNKLFNSHQCLQHHSWCLSTS